MALSLGTSGVVFATTDCRCIETARAGPRVLPRRARALAPDVGDALGRREPALVPRRARAGRGLRRRSSAAAGEVPAGSDGLFFLPYLSGERSPHPDPLARGAFVGLTLGHDRRHLTRAVLEGVAFGLRDGLDLMIAAGMPRAGPDPRLGRRHGEPALAPDPRRRPGAEIATVSTTEGAAYGAALLAAVGAGWSRGPEAVEAASARRRRRRRAAPRTGRAPRYASHPRGYRALYPALAPLFPRP